MKKEMLERRQDTENAFYFLLFFKEAFKFANN